MVNSSFLEDKDNFSLITIVAGMFLWSFSAGMVNISLPTISQYLDVNSGYVSWIIVAHLIVLISLLLVFGRLTEVWGQRRVFMLGVFIFTISSYLAGLSLDLTSLLLVRMLQGVGSAMMLAVAPSVISTLKESKGRGISFGYISIATTLGLSVGYLVGGILISNFDWNYIFFSIVPLGILVLIMAYFGLENKIETSSDRKYDPFGALIIFALFFMSLMAVQILLIPQLPDFYGLIVSVLMILILIIFIFWEIRHPDPILNINLIKKWRLLTAIATGFFTSLVLTGTIFLIPFYLVLVMSYSSSLAGMLVFGSTLFVIVASPISGLLSDRYGSKMMNFIGVFLLLITMILMSVMDQEAGILFIFLVLSIRALSDGVANPANSKMIMSHGTKDTIQNLSSLLNTARYLGLVSGVVLFESFFQSVIFSKSSNIERIAAGAIEYSLPTGVLVQGFHLAFFMGVIMAIIILVLVIVSKEENDYD